VGPSTDIGDALCARILTEKGTLVSQTSVFPLTDEEHRSQVAKERQAAIEVSLKEKLGKRYVLAKDTMKDDKEDTPSQITDRYEPVLQNDPKQEPIAEADKVQHEAFDKYISARVGVPQGDNMMYGTVKNRKRDSEGELIEKTHKNPLLDTSVYEVEFDNGDSEAYHANIIAESIYSQVDNDGYTTYLLKEIIDHKKDETVVSVSFLENWGMDL
jgi:hypothetical protein